MKTIVRLLKQEGAAPDEGAVLQYDENNFPMTFLMDDPSADLLVQKGWYREVTEEDLRPNPWCCMTPSAVGQPVVAMVMVPPQEVANQEAVGLRKLTEEEFSILTLNLQMFVEKKAADKRKRDYALADVMSELDSAVHQFGPIKSLHEAYGVIAEEFREFEEHVFMNARKRDLIKTRNELKQLGAMAIRTMMDCC